jgi:Flp pilus assembly pilin Flp
MSPHRRSRERGASLPEYALLVAVFALATLAGIDALQSSASAAFRAQADELSDGPTTSAPATTAPPSTAPPTTARPTTTTTSTTTTTTSTTTTTIAAARTASATWGATSSTRSGSTWTAAATLSVTDDRGQPVRGAAVVVLVEYRIGSGSWQQADEIDASTTSSGTVALSTDGLARTGRNAVSSVRYTLVDLEPGSLRWSGASSSVTLAAP